MTAKEAIEHLSTGPDGIARRDAETLLQHVTASTRASLLAHPEAVLTGAQQLHLTELASRRARHEPLQYLLGRQEFFGLTFHVSPDVLIPRPETELLVEAVLEWVAARDHSESGELAVVDVGTGSGAIVLALASRMPGARCWGLDLSPRALEVAQGNADALGCRDRVTFLLADLLQVAGSVADALPESLDLVVSNPPYVPLGDAPVMQPEVRDFEPHLALFAGNDGLDLYRRLIPEAWDRLRTGGLLAMEFGFGQRTALAQLLHGWQEVTFGADYAGIPRYLLAVRP